MQNLQPNQIVDLVLTLPFWTIITIYLLIWLVRYLRSIQYPKFYDKCAPKRAHFGYEFLVVVGKQSVNFNPIDANIILDLLDSHSISLITIQLPCSSLFKDNDAIPCSSWNGSIYKISFIMYRRHPIKEIKYIRIAHSSCEVDSRILIYGVQIQDFTTRETKFYPVNTVIRHRGTSQALTTAYDMKPDSSFNQIGANLYDPMDHPTLPTYVDLLCILIYVWTSVFFFTYLIPMDAVGSSHASQGAMVFLISGSSSIIISFVYIRIIKRNMADPNHETSIWTTVYYVFIFLILSVCISLCILASKVLGLDNSQKVLWEINSVSVGLILSLLFVLAFYLGMKFILMKSKALLTETEANLMKTNSKTGIEFTNKPLFHSLKVTQGQSQPQNSLSKKQVYKTAKSVSESKGRKRTTPAKSKREDPKKDDAKKDDDTLEDPKSETMYIKTKNRNSISQYI